MGLGMEEGEGEKEREGEREREEKGEGGQKERENQNQKIITQGPRFKEMAYSCNVYLLNYTDIHEIVSVNTHNTETEREKERLKSHGERVGVGMD